jgi:hypothetical protein
MLIVMSFSIPDVTSTRDATDFKFRKQTFLSYEFFRTFCSEGARGSVVS